MVRRALLALTVLVVGAVLAGAQAASSEISMPPPPPPGPSGGEEAGGAAEAEGAPPAPAAESEPPVAELVPLSPAEEPAGEGQEAGEAFVERSPEGEYRLEFSGAGLDEILRVYGEIAGATVVKSAEAKVVRDVTVINPIPLSREEALAVIEAVLEANQLGVVKDGRVYQVVGRNTAATGPIRTAPDEVPDTGFEIVTRVIYLRKANPAEMAALATRLVKGGFVVAVQSAGALVVADTAANVERVTRIVEQVEAAFGESELTVEIVPLENASEDALASILNQIFQPGQTAQQAARRPAPAAGAPAEAAQAEGEPTIAELEGRVRIIPDARLRALIIVTSRRYMPVVVELVKRLDVEGPEGLEATRAFVLQYAKAEDVVDVLTQLFKGYSTREIEGGPRRVPVPQQVQPGQAAVAGVVGPIEFAADERTNQVLVTTDPANFPAVEKLLEQLDARTPQVLIDALIAEVTYSGTLSYGFSYGTETTSGIEHEIRDGYTATADILPGFATAGLTYSVLRTGRHTNVDALLSAYAQQGQVNILSRPTVVVSNNEKATFKVTTQIPIVTLTVIRGSETGIATGERERSIDYKDVGITLTATPRISTNRDVSLETALTVGALGEVDPVSGEYTILERTTETTVVVADGRTLVIGGLLRDDKQEGVSKVPVLGDIPLLGLLFRQKTVSNQKTELLVFLTPRVIASVEEGDELTRQKEEAAKVPGTPSRLQARALYEEGLEAYADGDWRAAVEAWEEALRVDPALLDEQPGLRRRWETASQRLQAQLEEEAAQRAALEEAQRRARVEELLLRAREEERAGNDARALALYREALRLDPENRKARRGADEALARLERSAR